LRHRQIPASLHFENPNPQIAFDDLRLRVADRLQPWPETHGAPQRAGVNSFGFGGTNAHAILEAAPHPDIAIRAQDKPAEPCAWMLPLSARSAAVLPDVARSYLNSMRSGGVLEHAPLRDICFSAGVKRSHHEFRLALVAYDHAELAEQLEAFLLGADRANCSTGRASGTPSKPVFVCSGMGQQWWGMGCELLAEEPVYRQALEEVSEIFGRLAGWSLLDQLSAGEQASRIQETWVGQPAIFGLQVALARLLWSWGVEPAAVLGHSAGEMAAAHIAGALSLEDAVRVTFHRSRLQQRTAGQGAMLAAGIPRGEAERWVERHPRDISIAALNSPSSVTLSGDAAVLAEVDNVLNQAGLFSRALRVDVPFHSPKMEQLRSELIESLQNIMPRSASIPFFSTVTATALEGLELNAHYWYRNVRQPVLFHATIAALIEAGHSLFLEIGAHPILKRDILQCLSEKSLKGTTLSSLRREDRERAALLVSLGRLYTNGADIDWHKLYQAGATAIKLPFYPFQAESHWRESDLTRRIRIGSSVHPLLGQRLEVAKPSWKVDLDRADLGYLSDHRIGDSIVFPGAGYVEMGLAAARETFGSGPCVLEDVEFQRFLVLERNAAPSVQVALDPALNEFDVCVRADLSSGSWNVHARGSVRQLSPATPVKYDLAQIRERCPDAIGREEHYGRLRDFGYKLGPTFQGITRLWRSEREALAEIHLASSLSEHLSDYRLHPAILDACFHTMFAAAPTSIWQSTTGDSFVPVRIERFRFHAAPGTRIFAYTRLTGLGSTELRADLHILDHAGNCLVDVDGLIARRIGYGSEQKRAIYEYQWKFSPRAAGLTARGPSCLASSQRLTPILQEEAASLWRRFNRTRFQREFQCLSRATVSAYVARALQTLGWTPALSAKTPIEVLAKQLGLAPRYDRWLSHVLSELSADEIASNNEPEQLWKTLWDTFPECLVEAKLIRQFGENLPAVLRGDLDPVNFLFSESALPTLEHFCRHSETLRVSNLLVQKIFTEIVRRLPEGRALRALEIGGGTGGMTSFVLPVLAKHRTEYVFTDGSPAFIAHSQHKFSRFGFAQFRTLDIERNPIDQGFDAHSFDIIVMSEVFHQAKDLRKTVDGIRQLLGSGGTLLVVDPTRRWLFATLVFGLLKGSWLFDGNVRRNGPCVSQEDWKSVLRDAGFKGTICISDCPDSDSAQFSVILAGSPALPVAAVSASPASVKARIWLLLVDDGNQKRPSAGAELARQLRERGDRVIEIMHRTSFQQLDESRFNVRAGDVQDLKRMLKAIRAQSASLAGVVHLWSLDTETTASMTLDALRASAKLGCVGALQTIQTVAATDGLVVEDIWLITRSAQWLENRPGSLQVTQSPIWGLSRVAASEYQNMRYRTVDLSTSSQAEIGLLVNELFGGDHAEDEIALHGELRYVRRLVPVSPSTVHGMGRPTAEASKRFRFEVSRPGILESLRACSVQPTTPKSNEVEIEVLAAGLNFKDLMLAMGMLPKDADGSSGQLLGLECAGRIVSVGDEVTEFAPGDEVMAIGAYCLASHVVVDARFVSRKPAQLSFEQAATIPVAFSTAYYSLHTLARMERGERVLIHSATGGVGLAAVQLALRAGAVVFATAGTPEKRALLSALGVPYMMDSRSLAFADEIMSLTRGEGIDIVLNSLAGEAIDKNLSILRANGRFIEIGKVDIYKNRKLGMGPLAKSISLFAVDLTNAWAQRVDLPRSLMTELLARFSSNDLRPLPYRVFPVADISDAFRYMAQAKHVGKLIISMKDSCGLEVEHRQNTAAIDANASYLIAGGLGGLGLAVAERFAGRGARRLALVGRSSPSAPAHAMVESLRARGVEVMICQLDIANRKQTQQIIAAVQHRMGPLRGIVHAAMVLDDAPIERLTEERMWKAMAPKILGAWNLHSLTRDVPLDFFVLFSSIASVIGSPGQANYVAGNAFLDALAYYRRARGLPALAVNWGAVGGVGHVARSPETALRLERLGFKTMPVSETLDALDELISSDAVQVGAAEVEWPKFLRSLGSRTAARYSGFASQAGGEDGRKSLNSGIRDILEAPEVALPSVLETYIRDILARAMSTSLDRIDSQQPLRNLGLDSLIAVELRNQMNADFSMNVPLPKLMQNESISSLATYVAERLLESNRNKRSNSSDENLAGEESDAPLTGADAADLLERIDELTDEEVERQLSILEAQGQS
jgi:acyl transferase domain-containing protein/acyl carrier protein/ubiquinone/menaquinone biosynthesis C-methylase UbiE